MALLLLAGCYSAPAELCRPGEHCRQLVISNGGTGDLMGVPLLVELDPTRIDYALVKDPKTDLRFHDAPTDQDVPFEIDHWVQDGVSDVWIRVPALIGYQPYTGIVMTYGPDAHGAPDPAALWSDFELVSHLGAMPTNSVGAAYAPTATNVTEGAGDIGTAAQLAGTAGEMEQVDFQGAEALLDGWPTFTLELWVWPDYGSAADLGNQPAIYQKQGTIDGGRLFAAGGTDPVFQADLSFDNPSTEYLNAGVSLRQWNYLVYTYDNNVLQLYLDGQLASSEPKPSHAKLDANANPFYVGSSYNPMAGKLDELRISKQPRSADWILEQHLSAQRVLITYSP